MIYEWKLGPADVHSTDKLTDIVTQIHWYCNATAPNGTTWKASGSVTLGPPDPNKFIPFSKLSQAEISALVFSSVNKTDVEAGLSKQYADSSNPSVKPFNF